MKRIHNVSAVLFDMDGTLIDSETLTEPVIREYCVEAGIPLPAIQWPEFYGVSWESIATRLTASLEPPADIDGTVLRLHELYTEKLEASPPPLIPGARKAVIAASSTMSTGIVSSSFRESIDATIDQLNLFWETLFPAAKKSTRRNKNNGDSGF